MRASKEQLAAALAAKDFKFLWNAAIPWVKFSAGRYHDDDLLQDGMLAAGLALERWEPSKGAFSTHICLAVRSAVSDSLRKRGNGGIGSAWQKRTGQAVEMVELESDEDESKAAAELTYEDTGNVPYGFGDAGVEIGRQMTEEAIRRFLAVLDDDQRLALAASFSDEAKERSSSRLRTTRKALKKLAQSQSASLIDPTPQANRVRISHNPADRYPGFWNGLVSVMGDVPAWRESTGKVWNDWSFKPEAAKAQDKFIDHMLRRAA